MALIKNITKKGVTANYWIITDKNYVKETLKTSIRLRGYVSKEVRGEGFENYLDGFEYIKEFDGDLTTEECYAKATESVKVVNITTPETIAEDGTVTPAVTEEIETNELVDAVDDI
jgi:hypothetical protein